MALTRFQTWQLETLYEATKHRDREIKLATHSFRIYIEGEFDKLNRITVVSGNRAEVLPDWLAKRTIELLGSGSDDLTVEDALLYAADRFRMVGDIAVIVETAK